jgi:hypothetical protein
MIGSGVLTPIPQPGKVEVKGIDYPKFVAPNGKDKRS